MTNSGFAYQFSATFFALLNMVCLGAHEAWTSVYVPQLLQDNGLVKITTTQQFWITLVYFFGTLIGCSISLTVTDKFGRKIAIILASLPFLFSFIGLAFATTVTTFCLMRTLAGIGSGVSLVVLPLYIAEIAHPQIRGMLGTCIYIFNLLGFLYINLVGSLVSIKCSSLISSMIPLIFLLTFSWMPESPYYLTMKLDYHQAEKSLIKFSGRQNVDDDLNKLKSAVQSETKNRAITEIFTNKSNRCALFIEFILLNCKQLSGEDLFDVYAQLIFAQCLTKFSPTHMVILYYSIKIIVTIVSSLVTDRVGRKPILVISVLSSSTILLLLGTYLYLKIQTSIQVDSLEFVAVLILSLCSVFNSFLGPIPAVMVGELFPMNVKVLASWFCEIYVAVLSMGIIYFFDYTSRRFGTHVPIFSFSCLGFVHLIMVYVFVIETKGKTLVQIQNELAGNM